MDAAVLPTGELLDKTSLRSVNGESLALPRPPGFCQRQTACPGHSLKAACCTVSQDFLVVYNVQKVSWICFYMTTAAG